MGPRRGGWSGMQNERQRVERPCLGTPPAYMLSVYHQIIFKYDDIRWSKLEVRIGQTSGGNLQSNQSLLEKST